MRPVQQRRQGSGRAENHLEGYLKQDVDEINSILSQIQELNVAIRNSDIRGDEGLELRDQRNLLLDT